MEKHLLSKSTFIRGVQCLKSLYLYKNRYFLRDELSKEQLAKFTRGTNVGVLAQGLFPGGIDVTPRSPSQYRKSVLQTQELIEKGQEVIYEATFQFDRVMVMLDILVLKDGKYHAYEVKSSLKISETYLTDAALQYYVITGAGVPLADFSLVHVNPDYVLKGELELDKLFSFNSVLEEVKQKQEYIAEQIAKEKEAIALKHSPKIDIGVHCNYPYPCDFIGHCWKNVPDNSVFQLNSIEPEEQFKLYYSGKKTVNDITIEEVKERKQQIQLLCHQQNREFIDKDKLAVLKDLNNSAFFDINFFQPALPVYQGTKPYQAFPFSIGIFNEEKEILLVDAKENPKNEFLNKLAELTSQYDYLIIYDENRKIDILRHISSGNPEMGQVLNKVVNLYDFLHDFSYYHPDLKGDFSLTGIAMNLFGKQSPVSEIIPGDTIAGVLFHDIVVGKSKTQEEHIKNISDYISFRLSVIKELRNYLVSKNEK